MMMAAALLAGGLALTSAPASAAPAGLVDGTSLVEHVQYGYGDGRYQRRREGVRPGAIVRDLLGVRPRRDRAYRPYRGRGYGYDRRRGDRF